MPAPARSCSTRRRNTPCIASASLVYGPSSSRVGAAPRAPVSAAIRYSAHGRTATITNLPGIGARRK